MFGSFDSPRWVLYRIIDKYNDLVSNEYGKGAPTIRAKRMVEAVELMEDNHREMCDRLGVSTTHPHYVCHDALTYDYSFGEPVGVEAFFAS